MRPHIFFAIFAAAFLMTLANAQVSMNGISLPLRGYDDYDNALQIRQSEPSTFQWPRIDGPPETFPALDLLDVGYWTFNTTFLKSMEQLNTTDPIKAAEKLFAGLVEYQHKWLEECWKKSNASAKTNHRTNTLARVVAFPSDDPKYSIDPIYMLATPIMLACWERAKDGDINVAVVNHTQELIHSFKWDKEYALNFIGNQKKDFEPVPQSQNATTTETSKSDPSSKPI